MSSGLYEGIAIIGMAGRFPGAETVAEFWANLLAGQESISFFSDAELAESGYDVAALRGRGHFVAARGLVKDADCFDAAFFGIRPKEAEVMDPQQRLFLETCWAALESAGYPPNQMSVSVGVFGGANLNTYYLHVLHPRPDLLALVGAEQVMFGNEKDYLASRVAYKLGLKGPAMSVSTACSTSLVAVCQACQSLLTYQSDVALAGGASILIPQKRGYFHNEGSIASEDGHTRTFDARSTGTSFSDGVAVVVLKRLEDAVADNDQIYAVIKGAALNNDGSQRVSFGAPGVEGQASVVGLAHALAGVNPETITYVEAHGTATPLGDPIEVAALTKAFRASAQGKQFCGIGSVKTNIGHLDVAAGVAGLIKTALALHYKIIPASLNFTQPNAKLDLENSPFYVCNKLTDWEAKPGVPRRAGVSSFGMGGTNAHVVLEEAPHVSPSSRSRPWQLLVLSAKTEEALDHATENLAAHLRGMASKVDEQSAARALADAAFTLQTGRAEFARRRIVACSNAGAGAAALQARDPQRVYSHHQTSSNPPVVFMFPGQGAQYAGMGAELYRSEPVFRDELDRCTKLLEPLLKTDLRKVMFPAAGDEKKSDELLVQTRFTQPALFTIEYALAKLWMSWGIKPAAMIGHSVGEYVAGCLAGVFSLEDALSLVARRGALVQAQPGGAMLAVRLSEKELVFRLDGNLSIAAINAPNLCVVSGPYEPIAELEKHLAAEGVVTRHLHTSHAFHSQMMEPVLKPFLELLGKVAFAEPQVRFVSNVTARWITSEEAQRPEYWASHVRETVRFADGISELMKDPQNVLLEVGPGHTLSQLARQHPGKAPQQLALSTLAYGASQESRGLLEAVGRVWAAGVAVNWAGFYAGERRQKASLPTYPFERKRVWPESPLSLSPAAPATVAATSTDQAPTPVAPAVSSCVPTATSPVTAAMAVPRKERLVATVRSLLQDLSGYDLSSADASAGLLELGLDSLLLTQAAQLIHRKFGVSISFRQLMEEVSSIESIAACLDEKLAPEAAADVAHPATPAPERSAPSEISAAPATPSAADAPAKPQLRHGPFRPIDKTATHALTPEQNRALEKLIARVIQRTAGSKKLAAENRTRLADPRSVAGFNRLWKEMVYPISTIRSEGSKVWDVDGNEYVDFVMGFGASLFGHRPSFVVDAVREQLERGFEIGPIQPLAGEVAALLQEFTGLERFAFTNTGSEAVLAATRVARTVTGRDKIVVFAGAYHGILDEVLFRPAGGDPCRASAIAPGIPASALENVIVLDYGNPQSLEIIRSRGSGIAAVLVEPVQSRRLDIQPREFLHELRRVTEHTGAALVFDEVVTGFRVHPGGAQAHFGVRADLATYGKVVGGGLPIGVVAGSAKFMDALDGGAWKYGDSSFPEVGVTFFAGTFVRHPLVLAAAKAVLLHLKAKGPELQRRMNERGSWFAAQLRSVFEEAQVPFQLNQFSSLMYLTPPADQKLASLLFYLLRERGIHTWENRLLILTTAHTDEDFGQMVRATRESLDEMKSCGFLYPISKAALPPGSSTSAVSSGRAGTANSESARHADSGEPFLLSDAQQEIWLATQMGGEAAIAYNESLRLDFCGTFDVEAFRDSIHRVLERHPILLASLSADGQRQHIRPGATIDVPLIDFGETPEAVAEQRLDELLQRQVSEPFDLTAAPLVRVKIVRLGSNRHAVIWTAHHIVCDGWSNGVLISELAAVYSAKRRGTAANLEPAFPYREFAQIGQNGSLEARDSLTYWRRELAELPPPLELPTDHPRPAVRSARASTVMRTIGGALPQALKRLAAEQRTTLVVLLMTALKTLFYRLSGQTDLVIGLPVAGQVVTGHHCLIGHCVSLLPIRTQLLPDASFEQNLAAVKTRVLGAFDHSHSSIGSILQHLKMARSASRPTLVEVIFNVDRDPASAVFESLELRCDRNPKLALHFDMFLNILDGPGGLYLECDYNSDLFEAATIERWLDHFEALLGGILANPAETLDRLPLLSERSSRTLDTENNQTGTEFPKKPLHELFEDWVAKTPDARAVTFAGRHLSYDELNRRANQLAVHLRELGVRRGTLVGVLVDRSLYMMVALFGILKAGGAYVPLDPSFPQERLDYMVADSGMAVLVTHQGLHKQLAFPPPAIVHLDDDASAIAAHPAENARPEEQGFDALAYVLYTSGSTGKPKGVEVPHSALVNFLTSMQRQPGFQETDSLLALTTLSFDIAGLELYLPVVSGGSVVIASREDAQDPWRLMSLLAEYKCNVMQATPATWRTLVDAGWRGSPTLKILCGGESFPRDLAADLLSRCGELWNMYGPTETTIWSTLYRVASAETAIPIGKPIANTQVFVLDVSLGRVPTGTAGELFIGGAGLARGYLGRPELTNERFVANPFAPGERLYRTGDLARWRADGSLECLGRIDSQVKVRGYRIELGEVEAVLNDHEAVRQSAVTVYQGAGDQRMVAYFESVGAPPALADLRAHMRRVLPEYMLPSTFVAMDRLPLTSNGKIDRKALPVPDGEAEGGTTGSVAPRDTLEQSLVNIWSEVLKIKRLGIRDSFFDMGGHSLTALKMLNEVRRLTGRSLPLATLFRASTIETLADLLRQEGWTPSWASVVPIQPQGSRRPLFMIHGAEGNILLYRQLAQYLEPDQPVFGVQSRGLSGHSTLGSIEEMASAYLQEIQAIQPNGPYYLGGYCLGGMIALEIARQLSAKGLQVELVLLLETYNESLVSQTKAGLLAPVHFLQNLWFHIANALSVPAENRRTFIAEKLDIAKNRLGIRLRLLGEFFDLSRDGRVPDRYPHLKIKKMNDRAAAQYQPQPYEGRVAVIRPKSSFWGLSSASFGWAGILQQRLEVHTLPIYPRAMLVEPFCRKLAATIGQCLQNARA